MVKIIAVAVRLIVLHSGSGAEVDINPDGITSLRAESRKGEDRYFAEGTACMINTSDGKFVTVVETCEQVRKMIEEVDGHH
jgi:hypothetical protein